MPVSAVNVASHPPIRSRCRGQSTMLKTTITVFLAAAAALKKSRTAASLYFCWVSTAIRTSQALRTSSARCQFSRSVPSMSGVSRRMSRAGCRPPASSRHTRRSAAVSSGATASASLSLVQATGVKPGKSAAKSIRAASPCGRLATGCRVRAASGTEREISAPTSVLAIRLLPVFVPPQTAATTTGSRDTWACNLPKSWPCQSVADGSGAPSAAESGRRASINSQSSVVLPAQEA